MRGGPNIYESAPRRTARGRGDGSGKGRPSRQGVRGKFITSAFSRLNFLVNVFETETSVSAF